MLLIVGFIATWYYAGSAITSLLQGARAVGRVASGLGTIAGFGAAAGWVYVLAAVEGAPASAYAVCFFGIPIAAAIAARRLDRSRI